MFFENLFKNVFLYQEKCLYLYYKNYVIMRNYNDPIRYSGRYIPPQYVFEKTKEERRKEARDKLINNKAYIASFKTHVELTKHGADDNDWVLRSSDGDGVLLLFDGNLITEKEVNELKLYYKIDQGLHYFSARPIKYHSWKKLSDKRKQAARIYYK